MPNGSGTIYMVGDTANPSNVVIQNTVTGSAWHIRVGGTWDVSGFRFTTTGQRPGDFGNGIWVGGAANVFLGKNHWGVVADSHYRVGPSGYSLVYGDQTIFGSAAAGCHYIASGNGILYNNSPSSPNLTFNTGVTIAWFVKAEDGGQVRPVYTSQTNAAACAGTKYLASGNGVIQTIGAGVGYLPGTVAGGLQTGGQYL
jgi:hypothetical protein